MRYMFRRYRTASIATAALAVLLLVVTTAELTARGLLHSRLAAVADRKLGQGSEVRIDGGPALLDLFERHLDAVTVSSDHATVGRIPDVSVRARLDDLHLTGDHTGTVARTHADVEVPAASLQTLATTSDGRLPVSGVRLDARADTLTLALGRGGLGQATLKPELRNGHLILRLEDAEILGNPAPGALVDRVQNDLTQRTDIAYPLDLKATSVDVTETGLRVTLAGGPSRFPTRDGI
ncbi:LmeA family phospholipid-binding protein [Streptomyces cylindrosporus]|uniref:DUF2993 domain-containing protein n=1 Tax=Streptomyces cylindrosporus TaxID=2927583 RepID=A0ABS9YIB5_9ACTN|nr:DUF2993 domain-containing protein [Streptomyces cylindrosporus]MCI3276689.1 DUF2993 domain-containing protein [Streptomyces cylindrosporus]